MINESLRLPHFIQYYKNMGVDRFFFLDNDSDDDSTGFLKDMSNVHILHTSADYKNHWEWMDFLLDSFGVGNWCMVVEIDELFYNPHFSDLSLNTLRKYLETNDKNAVRAILLNMYSDDPVNEAIYSTGQYPLDIVPYFDKSYIVQPFSFTDRKSKKTFLSLIFTGGMRDRVFGAFYYKIFNRKLSKTPDIDFHYEGSEKFNDAQQLVDLGLMKTTPEFEGCAAEIIAKKENS